MTDEEYLGLHFHHARLANAFFAKLGGVKPLPPVTDPMPMAAEDLNAFVHHKQRADEALAALSYRVRRATRA
ncbi:MAG TPA: hypothetical protein VMI54_15780 [Polyangiaceae bacterium]|nr:hypothetical protein [Polyangiaceae bacterium]